MLPEHEHFMDDEDLDLQAVIIHYYLNWIISFYSFQE